MLPLHRARDVACMLPALGLIVAVAACSAPDDGDAVATPAPSAVAEHDQPRADGAAGPALPSSHVHGVGMNPADGLVYLATHDGLFRYGAKGPERVGPVIDLMGFAVAGPDHFYASGHPGPGVDLPQPLGLAQSTDGGQTWTTLSRGGQSDFHALTASTAGAFGHDGFAVQATSDGRTWSEVDTPVTPFAVASSPSGSALVLTSSSGLQLSFDGGATWQEPEAPLLQYVAFADDTVALGVGPDGIVARSDDSGQTWAQVGEVASPVTALTAAREADGAVRVVVVAAGEVLESLDGGAVFEPLGT